jgi:formylglycine-generating enzyme required for sulfatase activity
MRQRLFFAVLLLTVAWGVGCSKSEEEVAVPAQTAEEGSDMPKIGEMKLIPAGEFIMGSNKDKFASPEHKVNLPAYYMDVYEVTFEQWIKFLTESKYPAESDWQRYFTVGREEYPVANLTLDDAKAYAKWAGKRIPTEAEWEKAGRGPDGFLYPWGNTWDPTKTNTGEWGKADTVRVGERKLDRSPYGIQDMMGNVQEWTVDELKPYPGSKYRNEEAFKRGYYVARGASYVMWPSRGGGMFLYSRSAYFPKAQYGIGFRCVKDAEAPPKANLRDFRDLKLKQLALLIPNLDPRLN